MGSTKVTLWMEDRRYRALEHALFGHGSSVETELNRMLGALYSQQVPVQERELIEDEIGKEIELQRRQREAERRFCAFRITENGKTHCIETEYLLNVPQAALHCRNYLRDEFRNTHFRTLLDSFQNYTEIDALAFWRDAEQFGHIPNIAAVYDIDMDAKTFAIWENGMWRVYPVREASAAAYHAFRGNFRSMQERNDIFFMRLEGKARGQTEEEPGQSPELKM